MDSAKIRETFLKFFESKQHQRFESASLIPSDPSVLLTIAGMLPFKPIFEGKKTAEVPRATSCQKCIRVNDLDNVGRTPRHHTFFEMLGNFSFGDYFKKEAMQYALELLLQHYKLPIEKLYFTIYEKDPESRKLWTGLGVAQDRIFAMGADDNFWAAGPTGPCGPCSEIYYDLGPSYGDQTNPTQPGNRFLEIWNLVFMEFYRDEAGTLTPLPKQNIDTGMGLERIASILQNKPDNFETDLIFPIIKQLEEISNVHYESKTQQGYWFRAIADHVRASTHLLADGVVPTNEGRGYVLRRIIRRATRMGHMLGVKNLFLAQLADKVIEIHGQFYADLIARKVFIKDSIHAEEAAFQKTLTLGTDVLTEMITKNKVDAFMLHDTFGFPIELTQEIAAEKGVAIDMQEFAQKMEQQRSQSKTLKAGKYVPTMGGEVAVHSPEEAELMANHHSVTHLLHAALHQVLGKHATQAGSLVTPEALRFDFQHPQKLSEDELNKIETLVNQAIAQNIRRDLVLTTYDEAVKSLGALAFFGEKYGKEVRVIKFGDFSTELCGGTHVESTGVIELFKIIKESAISSGVRRIEAVAGPAAKNYCRNLAQEKALELEQSLAKLVSLLGQASQAAFKQYDAVLHAQVAHEKINVAAFNEYIHAVDAAIETVKDSIKKIEKEIQSKKSSDNTQFLQDLPAQIEKLGLYQFWHKQFSDLDATALKALADQAVNILGDTALVFLVNQNSEGLTFVAKLGKSAKAAGLHAGKLVQQAAAITDGRGGGNPEMAQAGGKNVAKLPEALAQVKTMIAQK